MSDIKQCLLLGFILIVVYYTVLKVSLGDLGVLGNLLEFIKSVIRIKIF